MKSVILTYIGLAVIVGGCCGTHNGSRVDASNVALAPNPEQRPSHETIAYAWQQYHIQVTFTKMAGETDWSMSVDDLYNDFTDPERVLDKSVARCSLPEAVQIIEISLKRFRGINPNGHLESVSFQMHIIRDLWEELYPALVRGLSASRESMTNGVDIPDEVNHEVKQVLASSASIAALHKVLSKYEPSVGQAEICFQFVFKGSLMGRRWSEIATLLGAGLRYTGMFEF